MCLCASQIKEALAVKDSSGDAAVYQMFIMQNDLLAMVCAWAQLVVCHINMHTPHHTNQCVCDSFLFFSFTLGPKTTFPMQPMYVDHQLFVHVIFCFSCELACYPCQYYKNQSLGCFIFFHALFISNWLYLRSNKGLYKMAEQIISLKNNRNGIERASEQG